MTQMSVLLNKRSKEVWSISPEDTVFEALKFLADHNIGAAMVIKDDKLSGVFSERDYTRKIALAGKSSKETLVRTIMSTDLVVVSPQTDIQDCLAIMSHRRVRHMPILDGDHVLGMISMREILNFMVADHELTISHLQRYISG